MSERESAAQRVLGCSSDRDVLGLPQSGPLTHDAIKHAFQSRALLLHPDKHTNTETSTSSPDTLSSTTVNEAFAKLVESRDRLLELLPLSQLLWSAAQPQRSTSNAAANARNSDEKGHNVAVVSVATTRGSDVMPHHERNSPVAVEDGAAGSAPPTWASTSSWLPLTCHTFGCLRELSNEDVQAGRHVCAYCRSKPTKCAVFGCLRMVTGGMYCNEHRV